MDIPALAIFTRIFPIWGAGSFGASFAAAS
jgi:hypothetical protein